ncbi:MAG: pyridoxamine 5'-phosphate oxidase family protein [Polyangiaceae bacterium]|nr:pyridoxamine 5'-phosphate oxidase family protein [Polyangiaceae bacterium]
MTDSLLYRPGHRQLQAEFQSERIADRLEEVNLRTEFSEKDQAFVERAPFFFLATVDGEGQPSVSYKGGLPGFVRVVGKAELAYPDYDGNGMFMSLGNVLENPKICMLFIDFETPARLVVRGRASIHRDDPLLAHTVGAQLIVRVAAESIYPNCPRYIHRMKLLEPSEYAPQVTKPPVEPAWKSFPEFRDFVPPRRPTASGR